MGVPRLYASFRPFAEHKVLQNERVIIDGPGFAYHILHVCRGNGILQPSYKLLGLVAISWLDEIARHNNTM